MKALTFNCDEDRYYIVDGWFLCQHVLSFGVCTVGAPWSVSREFEINDVISYMEDEEEPPANVTPEVIARFNYAIRENLLEALHQYQQEAQRCLT